MTDSRSPLRRRLLLIARETDPMIEVLKRRAAGRVVHASIVDLCREGWRYVGGRADLATARTASGIVDASQCAAVLCRIEAVVSSDLPWMHEDDRSYAAAEITAFLHAWLGQFQGIRLNKPTWMSLSGAGWHDVQARVIVSKLGIPVTSSRREAIVTVKVVGDEVFGIRDPAMRNHARRIAHALESTVLSITFSFDGAWKFHSADSAPALDGREADALLDFVFSPSNPAHRPWPPLVETYA